MPLSGMIVGTSCYHGNILFTDPSNAGIQLLLRHVTLLENASRIQKPKYITMCFERSRHYRQKELVWKPVRFVIYKLFFFFPFFHSALTVCTFASLGRINRWFKCVWLSGGRFEQFNQQSALKLSINSNVEINSGSFSKSSIQTAGLFISEGLLTYEVSLLFMRVRNGTSHCCWLDSRGCIHLSSRLRI